MALSAFDSFCRAAEQGRFPKLSDRGDLWQLLVLVTARKACDLIEHEGRDKRDWRRVHGGAAGGADDPTSGGRLLSGLLSREPDPAFAAQMADQCQRLLEGLTDQDLRAMAVRKLEGYTNEEFAAQLRCSPSTVERRLRLIRRRWECELGP